MDYRISAIRPLCFALIAAVLTTAALRASPLPQISEWRRLEPQFSELFDSLTMMNNGGIAAGVRGDGLVIRRPGGEWAAVSPQLWPGIVFGHVVAVDGVPGLVLASVTLGDAVHHGCVFRSTDWGETWDLIDPDPGADSDAYYRMGYSQADPSRIYLGAYEDLWASGDGGLTWSSIHPNTPQGIIFTDVAVHPLSADVILAGARGSIKGVFRSNDGGTSWGRVDSALHVTSIEWDPRDPDLVIAVGTTDNFKTRILRSADGGLTWTLLDQPKIRGPVEFVGLPNAAVAQGVALPDGNGAFYATLNGGLNWHLVKEFTSPGGKIMAWDATFFQGAGVLAVALDRNGVFCSIDNGTTWNPYGPSRGRVVVVEADPYRSGRWFVGTDDYLFVEMAGPGHRFLSEDAGLTWRDMEGSWPGQGQVTAALFSPADPQELHVGSDYIAGTLAYTPDGGSTWNQCQQGMPRPHCVIRSPHDPERLYAGHDRSLTVPAIDPGLWTRDSSWTWTRLWQSPHPVQDVIVGPASSQVLLAALGESSLTGMALPGGGLYGSADGGLTWTAHPAFDGTHVSFLRPVPGMPGFIWMGTLYDPNSGRIYLTVDNAATWIDMSTALPFEARDMVLLKGTPGRLFAATDNGVWESSDWGRSWAERNLGLLGAGAGNDLLSLDAHSIAADEPAGTLLVGTSAGAFCAQY